MTAAPLAIVGYGCRLPGGVVDGPSFWQLLLEGRDAITEIPPDRWSAAAHATPHAGVRGKSISRRGGFLAAIDGFEPECFGISPREADYIDPQQRLLLETAWEALEMAGVPIEQLSGSRTGVFVGISTVDYGQLQYGPGDLRGLTAFTAQGSALSIAASRISYCFDLRGPSLALDTACSSSLVALDWAARSLESGECDLALAGGVNLILGPEPFVGFSRAAMLSPDGRCKAFDAAADGFVRAEGAGVVVLKRLDQAVKEGDPVQAVVLGTGVNQDGRTGGLSMPNARSQAALLAAVHARAGVRPDEVGYVEAHGTGTAIGDVIEATALGEVFGRGRDPARPLLIGSVKTNVGHLEAGSGMAGLIKAILMLRHRRVPPSLHFHHPNPQIRFDEWRLRVPVTDEPWPDGPAVAGVSSFGFGGTNAHAVLRAYPDPVAPRAAGPCSNGAGPPAPVPLLLTARTDEALREVAARWANFAEEADQAGIALADVAYTAAARRSRLAHGAGLAALDWADARAQLDLIARGAPGPYVHVGRRPRRPPAIAFAFSGQGPQWHAMGRELLDNEPVFRAALQDVDQLLEPELGWSVIAEIRREETASRMDRTAVAQPAIFALQVALAALWESWGVRPAVALGHSAGEVAAAHLAGVLSLPDAVRLVAHRGRCLEQHALPGRMLAAALSEGDAAPYVGDSVCLAAVNGPTMLTFAGPTEAIERLAGRLTGAGIWSQPLRVRHAFHSPLMEPVREPFLAAIRDLPASLPSRPMISTVTGAPVDGQLLGADHWWRNVRDGVRFKDAIDRLGDHEVGIVIEVGPHPVLAASIRQCAPDLAVLPSLVRGQSERRTMVASLAGLAVFGTDAGLGPPWPTRGRVVPLPPHPWQRRRYWHEAEATRRARRPEAPHPLLGLDTPGLHRTWRATLDPADLPWLADHRVHGRVLFPAAGFVEILLGAATRMLGTERCVLDDVEIRLGLPLGHGATPDVQTVADPRAARLVVASRSSGDPADWVAHAQASYRALSGPPPSPKAAIGDLGPGATQVGTAEFYDAMTRVGLDYGETFRLVQAVSYGDGRAAGLVERVGPADEREDACCIHPALLDACLQVGHFAVPSALRRLELGYLPDGFERVRFWRSAGQRVRTHVTLRHASTQRITADVAIYTGAGDLALELDGFSCRAVGAPRTGDEADGTFVQRWRRRPVPEEPARPAALSLDRPLDYLVRRADAETRDRPPAAMARSFRRNLDLLDHMAHLHLAAAFGDRIGSPGSGTIDLTLGDLVDRYRPMIDGWLERLAEAGLARARPEGTWTVLPAAEPPPFAESWRDALARSPEIYPEARLLELVGRSLADIWRGRVDPLELLRSDEAIGLLEQVQGQRPWARYANGVFRCILAAVYRGLPPHRPLRILELGAGLGATADALIPDLRPDRTEYWLTDPSPELVAAAEARFSRFGFVRFAPACLRRSLTDQGIPPRAFDVVIAVDVLHRTENLRGAIRRAALALTKGGLLLLREPGGHRLGRDFVDDITRDRPVAHRLGLAQWKRTLAGEGFSAVATPTSERLGFDVAIAARARSGRPPAPVHPSPVPPPEPCWLVFTDAGGSGRRLAAALRRLGRRSVTVTPGPKYRRIRANRFTVRPDSRADLDSLRKACQGELAAGVAIVDLRDVDRTEVDPDRATDRCSSIVRLLQAIAAPSPSSLRLFLVTRGAHAIGREGDPARALHATVVGLGRVAANEFPNVQVRLVDLDPNPGSEVEDLLAELATADAQKEVAWRAGHRFVPRLFPASTATREAPSPTPETPAFEAVVGRAGHLSRVELRGSPGRPPGPGEVRVSVRCAALNFRDVLKALGTYPAETAGDLALGDEGAGIVSAVGDGVTDLVPGDRVAFAAPGCLRSDLILPTGHAVKLPPQLPLEAAATIPVAFATAGYALRDVGRLESGESVLIHSAAGGVGQAALRIARSIGARIFATAGTPAKRELVTRLGAELVMDSRGLEFADQVREATGGRGVDVILNSLAGHAMSRSLSLLAPGGRFLELGKRDFVENTRVGLRPLARGASYHAIDLALASANQPDRAAARVRQFLDQAGTGDLAPLPYRVFPVAKIGAALRLVAQGGHVGKIVLDLDHPGPVLPPPGRLRILTDRTYLITGAFGGVGLALTRWLASRGARHLVLVGRRGPASAAAHDTVSGLRAAGVQVDAAAVDVADRASLAGLLDRTGRDMPPLAGVFHLAMVLDDALILNLNDDRIRAVLRPKIGGAWNLHHLTADRTLDLFVMFGSASAALGSPGQANYAAANAGLEALAWHRRATGLPATTMAWGMIGEVGCVAERPELSERLSRQGARPLNPDDLWRTLDAAAGTPDPVTVVVRADWRRIGVRAAATGPCPGLLTELIDAAATEPPEETPGGFRDAILAADPAARKDLARSATLRLVAKVLGAATASLDVDRPLTELGLDSLMAVELFHLVEAELGVVLPLVTLTSDISIDRIATRLLQAVGAGAAPEPASALDTPPSPPPEPRVAPLAGDPLAPAVYCIHPAGGGLEAYESLAATLGDDCAVFGIESRLLHGAAEELPTADAMANAYADLVLAHRPGDVEYRLVGFSMGGLLALETARALERRGARVSLVGLIEVAVGASAPEERVSRLTAFLVTFLDLLYRQVEACDDAALSRIPSGAHRLATRIVTNGDPVAPSIMRWLDDDVLRPGAPRSLVSGYVDRLAAHIQLLPDHATLRPMAPTVRWRASAGIDPTGTAAADAPGDEHHVLDTDHCRIMAPPHSTAIAERLRELVWAGETERLDRLERESAAGVG